MYLTATKKRDFTLDVFRGLAIAIMIIVDAPPGEIFPLLQHAEWEGMTIADAAFPGFVFAMGASAAFSMSRREISFRKIFVRSAILFLIGLIFNAKGNLFSYMLLDNFTGAELFSGTIEHGRFFGILQRLALTYFAGMIIVKIISSDTGIFISAFALLILSSLGFHFYAPGAPFEQSHNLSGAIDLILPGANHIYTPTGDPEGLFGTIASTASMLFGFLAGKVLADNTFLRDKIYILGLSGMILSVIGGAWSFVDIISKNLWTAPFALLNAGGGMILFAFFLNLFNSDESAKKIFRPVAALGKNPLFFFLASNICVAFFCILPSPVEGVPYWIWLWQNTTYDLAGVELSVTIFCLIWCALWFLPAMILDWFGIVIKI